MDRGIGMVWLLGGGHRGRSGGEDAVLDPFMRTIFQRRLALSMRQGSGFKRTEVLARPRKRTMRAYQGTSTMGAAALLRSVSLAGREELDTAGIRISLRIGLIQGELCAPYERF